jgi:predicted ABC-type ATPase
MTENNSFSRPILLVFAGPNGSGKSTVTRRLPMLGVYVNADDIKKDYGLTDMEAAQQAELLRNTLLEERQNFSFETVLSTERNLLLMQKAKGLGYEVQCVYVLTCNANINVTRVRMRESAGGHSVPEDKIRSRYHKALALLPEVIAVSDKIVIYDNSDKPTLIFRKEGINIESFPSEYWSSESLCQLIGKDE